MGQRDETRLCYFFGFGRARVELDHLLTLVCYILILALSILFLWSNASTFIQKRPPHIPEFHIPEEPLLEFIAALRIEINCAFVVLRDIASGTINFIYYFLIIPLFIIYFIKLLIISLQKVFHSSFSIANHGTPGECGNF
ncbi:hypothetical protein CIPAW_03G257700 [Carya illinoinensis]|uniref:Reticulon domain-containing protein n=1 Tax=Carya illinoinensis TaxID=32201 RepID=A0A8T1R833_CARIL|nr:hypothetical protein CIPAW_03G257700 [Carya illinoinensis]